MNTIIIRFPVCNIGFDDISIVTLVTENFHAKFFFILNFKTWKIILIFLRLNKLVQLIILYFKEIYCNCKNSYIYGNIFYKNHFMLIHIIISILVYYKYHKLMYLNISIVT